MQIIKSERGYLTILTGKPDMGKSTFTIYDCSECLRNNKKVLFFSYEYCQSIIYNKLVSHFNMKWQDLYKLKIVDANGVPLDLLMDYIRVKRPDLDVVYIDYLDLLAKATYGENEDQNVNLQLTISKLAELAKELQISIVLLSQIGAEATIEETVQHLNNFAELVKKPQNVIKMFIAKGNFVDSAIDYGDISQIIHVDGNNLKLFTSANIQLLYKD